MDDNFYDIYGFIRERNMNDDLIMFSILTISVLTGSALAGTIGALIGMGIGYLIVINISSF